jgi:hypothetical protein
MAGHSLLEGADALKFILIQKLGEEAEKPVGERGKIAFSNRQGRKADEVVVETKAKREVESGVCLVNDVMARAGGQGGIGLGAGEDKAVEEEAEEANLKWDVVRGVRKAGAEHTILRFCSWIGM